MFGDPFPEYVSPALVALVAKHAPAELDLFHNWLRSMNSPVGAKPVVPEKSSNNSKRVEKGDVNRVASSSKNREHQSVSRNVNEKSQPRPMSESSSCLSKYRSTSSSKDNGSPRPTPKTPTSSLGSARKSSHSLTRIVPVKRDSATNLYKINERRTGLVNQQSSIVLDSNSSRGSVGYRRTLEKKSGKPPTFEGKEYGKELSLTILQSSGTTDKREGRSIRAPRVCDSPVGACEKEKPFEPSDEALTSRGSRSSRKSHPGGVSWKVELQHRTDKHSPSERKLASPKTDQAPTSRELAQKQKTSNKYEKQQTSSYKDRVKQFDQKRRAKMNSTNPKIKEHQPPWDFDVAVRSFDGVGPWFGSPTAKQQEMDIPLPVPTFDKFMGVEWESSMKSGDYGPSLRCFQTSIVELFPTKQFSRNDVREKRRSGVRHLYGTIKPKSRDPVIKRASWKRGVLIARKPHKSLAALGIVPPSRQQKAAERRMKNSSIFKMGNNRTQRDSSPRHKAPLKKIGCQIKKPSEIVTKMSTAARCSGVASKGMNAVPLNNQAIKSTSSRVKQNFVSQNISNATVRKKGVLITGQQSPETPKLPTGKAGQKRKQKEDVAMKKNAPRFSSCRESSNLQENKKLRQSVRENSEDSEKSCLPLIRNLAQQLINRVDAACTHNIFNDADELHYPGTLSVSEIPDCTVILPDSPLSTSESLILKQPEHIANDSVSDEILYAAALHPSKEKLDLTELEQAGGTPSLEHTSVAKDAITFFEPRSRARDKEELENRIMLLPEPHVKEDNNHMCLPRIDDNSETKSSRLIEATSDIFQIKLPNVERLKRDKKDDMHGRPSKLRKEEWSLPVKADPLSVINIYTKHRFCKEKEQPIFYRRECEGGVEIFEIGGDLTPKNGQGCCLEEITSPSGQEAVASLSSTILAGTELVQTGKPEKSPHVEYANQKRAEQTSSPIDVKQQENIRESTDTTMTSSSSHVVHWNRNLHRKDAVSLWRRLSVEMKKLKRIRRAWRHAYPPAEFRIDGWEDVLFGNRTNNEFSNHVPQNRRWHRSIEVEHKKCYKRGTEGECAASARNCEIPTKKQDVENDADGLMFPETETRENVLDYQYTRIRKRRKCRILPSLNQEAQKIDWLAKKVIKMRREAQQWRLKWKRHLLETELKRLDVEINETRTRIEKNFYVSQAQQSQVQTCQISQDLPSQSGSGKLREPMEPIVKLTEAPYGQVANTNLRETVNQPAKEDSERAVNTSNYSDSFISEQESEEKKDHPFVANKAELHEKLCRLMSNLNNRLRDSEVGLRQSHEIDSSRMEAARDERHMSGDLRNLLKRIKENKKIRSCSPSIKDLILPENLDCEPSSVGEHDSAQTVSEDEFLTEIQAGLGKGEPVECLSDHVEGIDKVHDSEHGLLDVVTDNEGLIENQDAGVSISLEGFTERDEEAQVNHGNAGVNGRSTFQNEVKSDLRFSFKESDTSATINTQGALLSSATKGFTEFPLQQPSTPFQSQDLCLHKGTTDEAQSIDEEESSESPIDADEVQRGSQSEINIATETGVSNRMSTSSSLEFLQRANMLQNPIFTEVSSTSVRSSTSHVLDVTNIKESSGFSGEASMTDEKKNVDERTESDLLHSTSAYSVKDISWSRQSVAALQDRSTEALDEKSTSPTWSYSSEMSNFSDVCQSGDDKGDDRSAGLSHTVANADVASLQTEEGHFEIQMEKEESTAYCESRNAGCLSHNMENAASGPARESERKKEFACPSPSTDDASGRESETLQMEGRTDGSLEVQQTEQRVLDSGTQQIPETEIQQIQSEQDNETQQIEPGQKLPDYDKPCEKQFLPGSHGDEKSGAPSNSISRNVDNSNPTLNTVQMLANSLDLDEDEIPEEIVIDDLGSTCTEDDADLTSEGYEQDLSRIRAAFASSTILEKNDEPGNCDDSGEDSASSKETFLSLSRAYYGSTDPPEHPQTEHGQGLDVQKAVLAEARLEHEIEKIEKHQIFSDRMTDVLFTNILQNEVAAMNPAHTPRTLPSLKTKAGLFPLTKLSVPKLSSKQHEDPNRQLLKSLELKGLQNIVASRSLSPVSSRVVLRDDYSTISQQYVQEYVVKFLEFSACPDTSNVCSMLETSMQHHASYQHHKRFNKILYDCVSECMVKGDTEMVNSEVAPALADKIVSYLKLSRVPACKLVIRLVEEGWQDCDVNVVTAELCEAVLRDLIEELIYEEGY